MGAKRKTAAKPDAEAAAKRIRAAAKAAAVVPTLNGGATVNANLQATLAACDAKIRDHFGAEVLLEAPSASSGTPAYNQRAAAAALGKGDPYTASCPLFWLNLGFEMQPAVPRYQSRITALQEHFFCEPYYLKDDPVVVYLNPGELPHQHQGALKACDPPEMRDALRQAVAKAIDDGLSAKQLNEWKECLMSVVFHFQARFPSSRDFVVTIKNFE